MKRIIYIRHGETFENVSGLYAGHIEATLTPKGFSQIDRLRLRLETEEITHVFCSDLMRARLTAEPVAVDHGLPLVEDPLLREVGGGIFEGRPFDDFLSALLASGLPGSLFLPEGGENCLIVRGRAERFYESVIAPLPHGSTALVVAHGGFGKVFLGFLTGKSVDESLEIPQDNTCVNIIHLNGTLPAESVLINCTSHLL